MRGVRQLWELLRTIRVRLTLWYVALLGVILVALSLFLYVSLSRSLRDELDRSLVATAQQAAQTLDIEDGAPRLGEGFEALPTGTVAVLYDPMGRQIQSNNPRQPLPDMAAALAQAARGERRFDTVELRGDEWRVLTVPLAENGRTIAMLQVGRSEQGVETALRQLVLLLALAGPATLLLAVAGGLFLAGRALGPIDRITRAAAAIGAEDLGQRLHVRSNDEVGRLAATFNGMLERLEAAFQRQRQFTADASHELRTPLAMLASQIDVARERRRPDAEYEQVLDSLREDVTRMSHLVGELLTLARADAGQERLSSEPLDLADLAHAVNEALQPLAARRGVHLRAAVAGPVPVQGDQTRLTQLLVNLVDNGLKYTPAGGTVSVAVRRAESWAVLEVADTGVGIAPEHLPRVFERFYRVDTARARAEGGTGLGLAIGRWITEAHGGQLTVASTPGAGTTFTVRLPSTRTDGQPRPPAAQASAPGSTRRHP